MTNDPNTPNGAADVLRVMDESAAVLEVMANGYSGNPEHRQAAKQAREARAAVAALIAEREALREDAERYRHSFDMPSASGGGIHYVIHGKLSLMATKDKMQVDSVIDAARTAAGEVGNG